MDNLVTVAIQFGLVRGASVTCFRKGSIPCSSSMVIVIDVIYLLSRQKAEFKNCMCAQQEVITCASAILQV